MFKSISTALITGFITLLPIASTIYLLFYLAIPSEKMMDEALPSVHRKRFAILIAFEYILQ